jgi:hypothetical protein
VRSRWSSAAGAATLLAGLCACNQLLGIDGVDRPPDAGPDGPGFPECRAQRVVHLVAGTAGLAWFTLAWPVPAVITGYQTKYAYDNPADARDVTTDPRHPLFARRIGTRVLWEGLGNEPQPSVFVAGVNESLTNQPRSIVINGGVGLIAAGATLQISLAPTIVVLQIAPAGPYDTATGAPQAVQVGNVDQAIAAFHGLVAPEIEQELRPSAAQLASYLPAGALPVEVNLGTRLAFSANALRLGLVGSIITHAFNDDPQSAWSNGPPTQRANNLASMLDAFYRDISTSFEARCGRDGQPLSLADNVVMIVTGDTPDNSFDVTSSWPNYTPGNSNWMYVRSNGFTRPGWFGQIQATTRTNFDPITGEADPLASVSSSTAASFAGALYAIARGDRAAVKSFRDIPFDGVVLR